ncbi:hypothetical protein P280DRAFT_62509 [Massarina eburnea CBS 473.64]|uniref:Uncharacterized protein n=1 Tax=Massarina eburnea CBS 473.64 TaxID=1395130 RepID=A0A6A6RWH3_9PLEO|nr:hypothetical protein P280DRAFT_62509 [Massarina eburnea CBS 473.64]
MAKVQTCFPVLFTIGGCYWCWRSGDLSLNQQVPRSLTWQSHCASAAAKLPSFPCAHNSNDQHTKWTLHQERDGARVATVIPSWTVLAIASIMATGSTNQLHVPELIDLGVGMPCIQDYNTHHSTAPLRHPRELSTRGGHKSARTQATSGEALLTPP